MRAHVGSISLVTTQSMATESSSPTNASPTSPTVTAAAPNTESNIGDGLVSEAAANAVQTDPQKADATDNKLSSGSGSGLLEIAI